ncbi:MAG: hypothetical protein ACI4HN_10650 [Ruminococcus sp.]|uniref:hypothetical protein n=1 Tax=Ruminococcus sp. TaxID=41978 RepID=UPI003F0E646C
MAEEKCFKRLVKQHKKEIIVASVTIITVAGAVLLAKNIAVQNKAVKPLPGPTVKPKVDTVEVAEPMLRIINVREHLRKLPNGYHASAHKIQVATENGISLATNQTLVSSYRRCYAP